MILANKNVKYVGYNLEDIDAVLIRKSGPGRGALIGGSIGMGFGLYFGLAFCADSDAACSGVGVGLVYGIIFGVIGAIPGALLRIPFTKWESIYETTEPIGMIHIGEGKMVVSFPSVYRKYGANQELGNYYQLSLVKVSF